MDVRHKRHGFDQLLPTFPVANADLADEELVLGDVLLGAERPAVPLRRIKFVDVRSGVNDDHFLRRQLPRGDHHLPDFLAYGDDSIDTSRAELRAIPNVERKRNAAIDDESADRSAPRRRERERMCDAFVHVNDIRSFLANQPPQLTNAYEVELMSQR